jgi:hypothetical protein
MPTTNLPLRPQVSRVRSGDDLAAELGKVIDETFPTRITELADINSRCKELIEQLQDENVTILDLVQLLDKAYEINIEAHERLGAIEYLPLSRTPSRAPSPSASQVDLHKAYGDSLLPTADGTSTSFPPNIHAPPSPTQLTSDMLKVVSAMPAEKFTRKESNDTTSESGEGFQFSVIETPERLAITWPKAWGDDFLRAAVQNAQHLRDVEQDPTMIDFMVCHRFFIMSYMRATDEVEFIFYRLLVLQIISSARAAIRLTPRRRVSSGLLDSVNIPTPVSAVVHILIGYR